MFHLSCPIKGPQYEVFCVQSQTDKSPIPYFVQMYCCSKCHTSCSHVKVTCTCKMYRPNSICSHALVVAEKCGDLDSFLKWRVSQDKSYNFSSLATVNINTKSSGRKGNRQRRDRSQKKNQCSDASDNLWVENRQHVQPQPQPQPQQLVNPLRHLKEMSTSTPLLLGTLVPRISQIRMLPAWWTRQLYFQVPREQRTHQTYHILLTSLSVFINRRKLQTTQGFQIALQS